MTRPNRRLQLFIASTALAACATPANDPEPAAAPVAGNHVYTCPDGLRLAARVIGDSVRLTLPDRNVTLPQVIAASGVRYEAENVLFWTKGLEARLEVDGTVHDGCVGVPVDNPWDEARLLGSTFRAVGQEPGWVLDVFQGGLRYLGDYGATLLVFPALAPFPTDLTAAEYQAAVNSTSLKLTIREAQCTDTMSGEQFTHEVTLTIDGRELRGCGRRLTGS